MQMYVLFLDAGCKDKTYGPILKELMQTKNFRVAVVGESDVVEICGALKVSFCPPSNKFTPWFSLAEMSVSCLCFDYTNKHRIKKLQW